MSAVNILRKPSLLSNFSISDRDEERVIEEVLTTPYEKVIKILMNLKLYLENNKSDKHIVQDLSWVIARIQSHSLYAYDVTDNSIELEKYVKNSHEVKSFIGYLQNYSETKEIQRRNKVAKVSKTVKEPQNLNVQGRKSTRNFVNPTPSISIGSPNSPKTHRNMALTNMLEVNIEESAHEQLMLSPDRSPVTRVSFQTTEFNPFVKDSLNLVEIPTDDLDRIMEKDFDIFEFEKLTGRENSLVVGAKIIFENMDIDLFIDPLHIHNFLKEVKNLYKLDSPYHNDLHGLDVCQTTTSYIRHSNMIELLHLTDLDISSMVIASLVHDLAHPGLTNSFMISSYSDLAVTYNDISILENYHICETFKILQKPGCNIFGKLNKDNFKLTRKRMIESILATDMTHHAKINTTLKNKLQTYNVTKGNNSDKLVNANSDTLFEDQQAVINFVVHTADLSHSSKSFDLSYKWTYMLMNEFWRQGDKEKSLNLQVNFLCDRDTADVPKSQIGFIKGIIMPTFEILIDLYPSLIYYKDNVSKNLEEWGRIITEEEKSRDKK